MTNFKIPAQRIVFSAEERVEILRRIDDCLASGHVAAGRNVQELEAAAARMAGVKHAVATNGGGPALGIALRQMGVAGREVLVPTNTFAATATEVLLAGGRVRLVDVDPATFSVSSRLLEAAASAETAGVIVVHVGGIISPDLPTIEGWCRDRGLWLLEDAAHAHGSTLDDRRAGQFGRAAAFSFSPTKVVTSGEGGVLVTDDDDLAAGARSFRDYGKAEPWVSYHTSVGTNARMSEICAAVGVVQLNRLPQVIASRERIASLYTEALRGCPEVTPILPRGRSSGYKYILMLRPDVDRDRLRAALKEKGVSLTGGVFDIPLHRQPIFGGTAGDFPGADEISRRHVCLPIYFGLSDDEARYVAETLRSTLAEQRRRG